MKKPDASHAKRWVTGLVLAPLLIVTILASANWFFALFICAVCCVALYEYYRIALHVSGTSFFTVIPMAGCGTGAAIVLSAIWGRFDVICALVSCLFIFSGAGALSQYKRRPDAMNRVVMQVIAMVYLALPLAFLVMLHQDPRGNTWILMMFFLVFCGDIGAYYAGTFFGRHKLIPEVSPGKTIEGAFGGMTATVGIGCLINLALPFLPWGMDMPRFPWVMAPLFFVVVSICGQAGDLFESLLKREAGLKDSGVIFPGHGGLLDRVDAVLFAIPIVYLFKEFVFVS
ncbi:MAG: phosphatidate cytidylyltransferase [Thermodesulfobacteriota bacterium]